MILGYSRFGGACRSFGVTFSADRYRVSSSPCEMGKKIQVLAELSELLRNNAISGGESGSAFAATA